MDEDIGTPPIRDEEQPVVEPITGASDTSVDERLSDVTAAEAWNEVVARMGELGDAITRWTKAAANDPENRRRVEEVNARVGDMATKAETAIYGVSSDIGEQVRLGMAKAGKAIDETARKVSAAAAPHISNAFAELSNQFARAAARVDQAITERPERGSDNAPPTPPPPAPPIPEEPAPIDALDESAWKEPPVDRSTPTIPPERQ